jgi:hypothetical protein
MWNVWEEERCIQGFSGKLTGRRPLGRPRRRWEDKVKINIRKVEWGNVLDLLCSGQGHVADFCKCGNELSGSIKCREFLDKLMTC